MGARHEMATQNSPGLQPWEPVHHGIRPERAADANHPRRRPTLQVPVTLGHSYHSGPKHTAETQPSTVGRPCRAISLGDRPRAEALGYSVSPFHGDLRIPPSLHHSITPSLHHSITPHLSVQTAYWAMPLPKDQFSFLTSIRLMKTSSRRSPTAEYRSSAIAL
jgi:hypothetical protein